MLRGKAIDSVVRLRSDCSGHSPKTMFSLRKPVLQSHPLSIHFSGRTSRWAEQKSLFIQGGNRVQIWVHCVGSFLSFCWAPPRRVSRYETGGSLQRCCWRFKSSGMLLHVSLVNQDIILYDNPHRSSLILFRVKRGSATVAALPFCRESGSTPYFSLVNLVVVFSPIYHTYDSRSVHI